MKRLAMIVAVGAGVLTAVGCGYDSKEHARQMEMEQKWAGKMRPEYHEFTKGNRIYVVGSKASMDKVQGGGKLSSHQAAMGFGPNRETVIFEASKDGMEDLLMQEYKTRHPELAGK